ncbi:MAG: ankyrin repeat domain-containing protein [Candidatus Latescibacterota bacterium]|jgi:hypothetical protein|tara:strand:+ start:139 stop:582 length:444 start_codon:yes stop_codon:yes gene_type:complete
MTRFTFTSLAMALLAFVAVRAGSTNTIDRPLTVAASQTEMHDADGNTALIVAAAYGDKDRVRALINRVVAVEARGYIGNTALIFATTQEGHDEIAHMLLAAGADPDASNNYGTTARKLAVGYGYRTITAAFDAAPAPPHASWVAGIL